jgi:DNA-3-methyladenine glycosylase II
MEKQLSEMADQWRPYRGAAAILARHSYNSAVL